MSIEHRDSVDVDGPARVRVTLDARLTPAQANAARAAAHVRPQLLVDDSARAVCAAAWVVPRLDATCVEALRARAEQASCPLLVLSCQLPDPDVSLSALSSGAQDVLHGERFDMLFDDVLARAARLREIDSILQSPLIREHLGGNSPAWLATLRELVGAARFSDGPVLLLGETGTGKELLARLVHTLDRRSDKRDLLIVDCTTLTPELALSQLFGHERGAFTGSVAARRGAIAEADQGTLFLDEVGELPLDVQAKLLRTLQEGSYKPVGSDQWRQASFRLICATHRNLEAAVEAGRFRADLYFRIASTVLHVPPLRERVGDIGALADTFLLEFGCRSGIDQTVRCFLERHAFPGNVRELRQLMQSAARAHAGSGALSPGCLPRAWRELGAPAAAQAVEAEAPQEAATRPLSSHPELLIRSWVDAGMSLQDITQRAGDLAIQFALALEGNHVGRASRRLGVTDRAIQLRKTRRAAARSEPT
jgi:transcriptional regulator with GAF, ATPase, and Fis domain